jgi:hypothetical protein
MQFATPQNYFQQQQQNSQLHHEQIPAAQAQIGYPQQHDQHHHEMIAQHQANQNQHPQQIYAAPSEQQYQIHYPNAAMQFAQNQAQAQHEHQQHQQQQQQHQQQLQQQMNQHQHQIQQNNPQALVTSNPNNFQPSYGVSHQQHKK